MSASRDAAAHAITDDSLHGRVALVTGGTRGIGAAISESLARYGATVAAGYSSNGARAEAVRAQLGGETSVHQGNVGDPDDCARVVGGVIARHGRLDILINNAGVTVDRPLSAMTIEGWHQVLRINLSGAFYMCKPALAHMLERGSGRDVTSRRSAARSATSGRPTTPLPNPACSA